MSPRPLARINNPVAFVSDPLESHLERYRRAGFAAQSHIADWEPGLRTGFVDLWPEYLELLTVADEQRYESGADDALRAARSIQGIHAVELYSADAAATSHRLMELGYQLPGIREDRLATTDSSDGPDFYFLALPFLAGTVATTMTSTYRDTPMRRMVKVSENGVFALAGMTAVVDDPPAAAAAWDVVITPSVHSLQFLTPDQWRQVCPTDAGTGGVVCLHLLSENPDRTVEQMEAAGWTSAASPAGAAHLLPHPADHIRFTVTHASVEDWVDQRRRVLGEQLTVHRT